MSQTNLADVTNQIKEEWAPIFTQQLRETLLLGSLVNREYDGVISQEGDTVYVSQVNAPTGELLTVGTDSDSFSPEALSTSRVSIIANRRAVASYKFADEALILSQISAEKSDIRDALLFAMNKQINTHLYSLVSPSTSAPDHEIASVTDLNTAQMSALRVLAGAADWPKNKPWYGLLGPQYHADVMDDTTMSSADFGATDLPMIGGEIVNKRFGFNLIEDTSRANDYGLFFYPDFMHMVMQPQVRIKLSDLHSNSQFGVILSVDVIFGAALGVDGANKHIRVQ